MHELAVANYWNFKTARLQSMKYLRAAFAENIIEKVSTNQHHTSHTGNPLLYDVVGEMPVRPVISVSCPSHSGRSNLSILFFPRRSYLRLERGRDQNTAVILRARRGKDVRSRPHAFCSAEQAEKVKGDDSSLCVQATQA